MMGRRVVVADGVEAGDAIARRIRRCMALLVSGEQIQADKLLIAVADIASKDFFGII